MRRRFQSIQTTLQPNPDSSNTITKAGFPAFSFIVYNMTKYTFITVLISILFISSCSQQKSPQPDIQTASNDLRYPTPDGEVPDDEILSSIRIDLINDYPAWNPDIQDASVRIVFHNTSRRHLATQSKALLYIYDAQKDIPLYWTVIDLAFGKTATPGTLGVVSRPAARYQMGRREHQNDSQHPILSNRHRRQISDAFRNGTLRQRRQTHRYGTFEFYRICQELIFIVAGLSPAGDTPRRAAICNTRRHHYISNYSNNMISLHNTISTATLSFLNSAPEYTIHFFFLVYYRICQPSWNTTADDLLCSVLHLSVPA